MTIWRATHERLDRPWKRAAFILWIPLFMVAVATFLYALLFIYKVYFENDFQVWACHRDLAGYAGRPGEFTAEDMGALRRAHELNDSRFSPETMALERSREFMNCMRSSENWYYWSNFSLARQYVLIAAAACGLFALIIFPRFWRSIGGWIAGRPN
jgi:hypothetical protein